MSDKLLRALMQLFAIVANSDEVGTSGREVVERFLRRQISGSFVATYLEAFDQYLDKLKGKTEEGKQRKRTSVNSVKVLRICTEINKELEQKQKIIVLIRLFEFLHAATDFETGQHNEFIATVAETFGISASDKDNCAAIVTGVAREGTNFLTVERRDTGDACTNIVRENFNGKLLFLEFPEHHLIICTYFGTEQLYLDGRAIVPGSAYVFAQGSVLRCSRFSPIFYNEVIHAYIGLGESANLSFQVTNLGYRFNKKKVALHDLTFTTGSGNLVGIMGNSGAGKTTLLNLLNGSTRPTTGEIKVNGVNLYGKDQKLHGLIGNIPQDDLLIEDLTVFQNLFYSSKLYFGSLSDAEITEKVNKCLNSLLLYGIKDLIVGDALNKSISGGQRKRLNIALELIREPEILFVDEPTSGLSSNDSENVMDLLKQLTLTGKLIFVVIHQPSSEIFKLFDQLLLLDTGGYPAYFGNPVDAIRYFRKQMNYADFDFAECPECGNINPEEIFRILDAKTVDEYGRPTKERRIPAQEWYRLYNEHFVNGAEPEKSADVGITPPQLSGRVAQFLVYLRRNFFSKLQNRQYVVIALLEGPVLALILAIALRSKNGANEYLFGANTNIVVFMFISIIVALFMGLTSSAEEIIQDKKILKRESFLQLSRNSYILSKIVFLMMVSAIQTFLFLAIGNTILGFPFALFGQYFVVLFSVSCFGNLLGLNISAGMKTRVAVYILIPLLIIPQIMLSGVLVKFDDLSPWVCNKEKEGVPTIGNIMVSRWAFEALATCQYKDNEYEKWFFETDSRKSTAAYYRILCDKMEEKLQAVTTLPAGVAQTQATTDARVFFMAEFARIAQLFPGIGLSVGTPEQMSSASGLSAVCTANFAAITQFFNKEFDDALARKEKIKTVLTRQLGSADELTRYKLTNNNDRLAEVVTDKTDFGDKLVITGTRDIRKFEPIYTYSASVWPFSAPFYAYAKSIGSVQVQTIWFNLMVIWFITLLFYVTLYYDLLRKLMRS